MAGKCQREAEERSKSIEFGFCVWIAEVTNILFCESDNFHKRKNFLAAGGAARCINLTIPMSIGVVNAFFN